jgi:hypothetical protein
MGNDPDARGNPGHSLTDENLTRLIVDCTFRGRPDPSELFDILEWQVIDLSRLPAEEDIDSVALLQGTVEPRYYVVRWQYSPNGDSGGVEVYEDPGEAEEAYAREVADQDERFDTILNEYHKWIERDGGAVTLLLSDDRDRAKAEFLDRYADRLGIRSQRLDSCRVLYQLVEARAEETAR